MNIVFEYIKYRLNAKHLHGIHSPFVYDFMKKAMNIQMNKEDLNAIQSCVSAVKDNKTQIEVTDYGAKSKKLKKNRTVKQIFGTSSSYGKNALLLYRISAYFRPNNILELGTSIGIGSLHLHMGAPEANLTTIEGCPKTYKLAEKNIGKRPIKRVNKTFYDYIKSIENQQYDLIFIDGHHDGEALKYYVQLLDPYTHNDTIIILDDIRWSSSMYDAWNSLKNEGKYHLSMDFFRMGILSKRSQQRKENFVLKLKK